MRNKIFIVSVCSLFVVLCVYCPLSWIFDEIGIVALPETANKKLPEREYADDFLLSAFLNGIEKGKAEIENVYTNYLPFYTGIVGFMKDAERSSQKLLLDIIGPPAPMSATQIQLSDPEEPSGQEGQLMPEEEFFDASIYRSAKIGEDGNNHHYYAFAPGDFIEGAITLSEEALKRRAAVSAGAINRIAEAAKKGGANTYLYNVSRMQDNDYFKKIVKNSYSTRPVRDYFNSLLDSGISVGWLDIGSVEKALEKIYRTDHHWSPLGTYSGYCDIIAMMRKKIPDIGEPYPMKGMTAIEGVKWRGYYSALSVYSAIYEDFTVMDIELPEHMMLDAGGNLFEFRYEEYINGIFPTDAYFGHYNHYHGQPHQISYPNNQTGRRLLFISDSMTYSVARLIASHFDESYMLYPWDSPPVQFEQYLETHKITDVLFLMFSDRLMFNMYGDCDFSRYKTQ